MMKKTFITSVKKLSITLPILLLVIILNPQTAISSVAVDIVATSGNGIQYDFSPYQVSFEKIFSRDTDFGQDLYMAIHKKIRNEGTDLAISRTLAHRSLTKEELLMIIPGANIGELMKQDSPKEALTPQEIEKRRADITQIFQDEKEISDLLVSANLEVMPVEIFSNGDESDSGFDLVSDLDIIEVLLFGRQDIARTSQPNGAQSSEGVIGSDGSLNLGPFDTPPDGESGGSGGAQAGSDVSTDNVSGNAGTSETSGNTTSSSGGNSSDSRTATGGVSANEPPKTILDIPEENVAVCTLNNAFNDAVKNARERDIDEYGVSSESGGGSNGSANSGNVSGGSTGGQSGQNGQGGPVEDNNGGGAPNPNNSEGEDNQNTVPESAGSWSRPNLCNNIFCIKIEKIMKEASLYSKRENCNACHFEKINDAFKKTLDFGLIAHKVTGNLFEVPICKKYLLDNLKMSIITVPKPIITPKNDSLVTEGDLAANVMDTLEKFYGAPGRCAVVQEALRNAQGATTPEKRIKKAIELLKKKTDLCKSPTDPATEAAPNILNQSSDETNPVDLLKQIDNETSAKLTETADVIAKIKLDSQAENQAKEFQVLMVEIDTMNAYFDGFRKMFTDIVGDPCQTLLNKETCS